MVPKFEKQTLQAICDVLGATQGGLTGGEIGQLLHQCRIEDHSPGGTKRYRLFEALEHRQQRDGNGNNVAAFIMAAMSPLRYTQARDHYESFRSDLNIPLAFAGLKLKDDGKLYKITAAKTLSEAEERAGRLRQELRRRQVHSDVLKFCKAELIQKNYFHAVFEATKSVADKIRDKAELTSDGSGLVDQAFALGKTGIPILAINSLRTETEESEQKGFANLLKGLFGTFRNVTAHAPKIKWDMSEQDALDLFTLASYCHRRIDQSVNTRKIGP